MKDKLLSIQLDFPAVTVCNLNRVDCLRLKTAIETCEESNYTTCEFVAQVSSKDNLP